MQISEKSMRGSSMRAFANLSILLILVVFGGDTILAQGLQSRLNATGQVIVDQIKASCRDDYPDDEAAFRECAQARYDAMRSFFSKLFHNRDFKGANSPEFLAGIKCVDKASPKVDEPNREVAVERADWAVANSCYENALKN